MSKKYSIGKRSDMQRFHRDMMKKIGNIAEDKAKSIYEERTQNIKFYENVYSRSKVECPNCHNKSTRGTWLMETLIRLLDKNYR